LRILHVSSARAFGGGERHLVDLTRGLALRGHEVGVAITANSPLRAHLDHLPVANIHTLPLRNALDLPSALQLARLARAHHFEILHAHVARDYPPVSLAARLCGARLVITRHVLFPLGRVHRLALANVARVIAVSESVARALRERNIFPQRKLRVVVNGIDSERIEAARAEFERATAHRARTGPLRVGIVGSLVENKGHDLFIRAAATVISILKTRVEFVIIGREPPRSGGYRATLEQLIEELDLVGRVRLLTDETDPVRLLPTLDLFVSASRSEAFGLAMAEALACGVPVVATATDGAREVVEHGVNGTLVPPDDAEALAAAIVSLLEDDARRRSYSHAARDAAHRRFSLGRMVSDTERVYLEALARERAGEP
jgi:glycosyltransferase involved in cell wall biosynthesis